VTEELAPLERAVLDLLAGDPKTDPLRPELLGVLLVVDRDDYLAHCGDHADSFFVVGRADLHSAYGTRSAWAGA
jgi:hypothetical protein